MVFLSGDNECSKISVRVPYNFSIAYFETYDLVKYMGQSAGHGKSE